MDFYLDESFEPKTEIGKKLKSMVENGEHCEGNIYWLIEKIEQLQKDVEFWRDIAESCECNDL
jgi:hypothetical protein